MVIVKIPDLKKEIADPEVAKGFLKEVGVDYEHWQIKDGINELTTATDILTIYNYEIESLKKRGGYVTADVIDINSSTPGLDDMLNKFKKEHYHSEDEVRFTVLGHGIFHIHPEGKEVIAVVVEPGDMLRIPKGMSHWFELCDDRRIKAVRLFQDMSGWTPYYVENGVHGNYMPVCFGPTYINRGR
ncbi:MAG: cupin domain-containing protein [Thermoplasmatales archaeon]